MENRVLVTGFDPFGGEAVNPAWEAVKRLPECIGGVPVEKAMVPTEFDRAGTVLAEAMATLAPRVVICVGQAGGAAEMRVERVAINLRDARIPDNAGVQPEDMPVREGGPNAYFASLPLKAIVAALRGEGIPAGLSCSAGTYVCNSLFYTLMDLIHRKYPGVRGGFIHVPYEPEQAADKAPGTPSMDVAMIAKGLEIAIRQSLNASRGV